MAVDAAPRFRSWLTGNAGRIDPTMAPEGSWFGVNVQAYPSGLVGPRWGLKQVDVKKASPAGDPITIPVANGPKGFATIGDRLFVVADALYTGLLDTLETTGTVNCSKFANYAATPAEWVTLVGQDADNIFALADGALYQHVVSTLSTAAVTTPATFSFIRRWGFYCVGIDAGTPYRLWFSEVSDAGFDFTSWPALNYVDIGGDSEPITAIVPLYNTLYVGKRSGWWAITGVVGTSTVVRQVALGDGPVDARGVAATVDNRIAYWPRSPHPAFFNGAVTTLMLDHVTADYAPSAAQAVAAAPTGRATVFGYDDAGTSKAVLLQALGGPSVHEFGVRLAGWAPDVIENGYGVAGGYVLAAKQTTIVGETLQVYYWRTNPDRVPVSTDDLGSLGDGSDAPLSCTLRTRAWIDPQGRDVRVRSVTVRFRAWGIGGVENQIGPKFGMAVERMAPFEDRSDTSPEQWWRAAYGEVPVDGGDYEVRWALGDQGFGAGFQINLVGLQGVAIRDVIVGVEFRGART